MLISQMLQVNVDARFTAEEVLSHAWVTVSPQTRGRTHKAHSGLLSAVLLFQDEAPLESNTVSSNEDHAEEEALESDQDSPVLETKQVPSPLV